MLLNRKLAGTWNSLARASLRQHRAGTEDATPVAPCTGELTTTPIRDKGRHARGIHAKVWERPHTNCSNHLCILCLLWQGELGPPSCGRVSDHRYPSDFTPLTASISASAVIPMCEAFQTGLPFCNRMACGLWCVIPERLAISLETSRWAMRSR